MPDDERKKPQLKNRFWLYATAMVLNALALGAAFVMLASGRIPFSPIPLFGLIAILVGLWFELTRQWDDFVDVLEKQASSWDRQYELREKEKELRAIETELAARQSAASARDSSERDKKLDRIGEIAAWWAKEGKFDWDLRDGRGIPKKDQIERRVIGEVEVILGREGEITSRFDDRHNPLFGDDRRDALARMAEEDGEGQRILREKRCSREDFVAVIDAYWRKDMEKLKAARRMRQDGRAVVVSETMVEGHKRVLEQAEREISETIREAKSAELTILKLQAMRDQRVIDLMESGASPELLEELRQRVDDQISRIQRGEYNLA